MAKLVKVTTVVWLLWCAYVVIRDNVWAAYKPG